MSLSTITTPPTAPPSGSLGAGPSSDKVTAAASAGFCFILVSPTGRLSVLDAPSGGARLFPLGRRTVSGLVWRVEFDDQLVCWLDGDAQDGTGQANLAATQMVAGLIGHRRIWPLDEPLVCGTALFTGLDLTGHPVGLSDRQVRILADAHAGVEDWDYPDPDHPDGVVSPVRLPALAKSQHTLPRREVSS